MQTPSIRALALLTCLAGGCATASGAGESAEPAGEAAATGVGQPVRDLTLSELRGPGQIRLADLRGKVVLLDIWASWCAPCKEEMPILDQLAGRLRARGVEVVAVSIDEDREAAEAFLQSRKRWSLRLAHDPKGQVPEQLKPPKMPTSYIIDRAGIVRHVQAGFEPGDAEKIERRLIQLADADGE